MPNDMSTNAPLLPDVDPELSAEVELDLQAQLGGLVRGSRAMGITIKHQRQQIAQLQELCITLSVAPHLDKQLAQWAVAALPPDHPNTNRLSKIFDKALTARQPKMENKHEHTAATK